MNHITQTAHFWPQRITAWQHSIIARRRSWLSVWVWIVCCCLSAEIFAQNVQYTNKAIDLGVRSKQRVNPITRGVEIEIPLGHYPGRNGLDVPVTLSYSSKVWGIEFQGYNTGAPPPHQPQPFTIVTAEFAKRSIAGWTSSIGFPVLDFQPGDRIYDAFGNPNVSGNCTAGCYVIDRMMVWMPDGSGHELRASDQPRPTTQAAPDNLYSVDGTRMRYQKSAQILYLSDGSQYQFASGKYVGRNGNALTWVGGWRDSLDRTINNPLPYNQGSGPLAPTDQTYSIPGVGNTTLTYTLKWRNLADVLTTAEAVRYIANGGCPPGQNTFSPSLFSSDDSSRTCIGNAGVVFNPVVLSQIVLPNGQSYTFTYDIFGGINKIVLPTGGYEKFEHAYVPPVSSPTNFKLVYAQGNRGVTRHVLSPTRFGTDEVEWLYSGAGNYVSMTAPDGSRTESHLWTDGVSGWGYSADSSRAGKPYDERVYSSAGQMLRRKLTDWIMTPSNASGNPTGTQMANRNARISRQVEFVVDGVGPALAKTITYSYDTNYQYDVGIELAAVNEFAFVEVDQNTAQTVPVGSLSSIPNGTPLRTTEFEYLTNNSNYRSRNLLGLVTTTRIKNGSNTVVAQSSHGYDETALLTYPSVVGWSDPGTYRGNVTTVTSWLNFNGSTFSTFPQGTYVSTRAQYDQCGSLRKSWDARDVSLSNPAQIDYSSTYHRAYPTTQISSDPDLAGPLVSLSNSTEYDFSTGLVTATIDANSQRTTFDYTDSLNRLKQIVRAETDSLVKNQTTHTYDDVARTITTTTDLNGYNDNLLKMVMIYDALGRIKETQQHESPSSYISAQQQYDEMGRVFKTSSPFRPLQGESAVWTTHQYDDLERRISTTTPDSAVVSTSYSGNVITVTDQTGKQRKSITDSLGRVTRVIEAPNDPNFNYLTEYEYDTLDSLVKVTQGAQLRYYRYDSLKRLIRARNPEQSLNSNLALADPLTGNSAWSIGNQYDENGNLTQRTDARGIVSTNVYDALNRNTTINYSDTAVNPDITRVYDGATKGLGRLSVTYSGGNETLGDNVEKTVIDSYDGVGRPKVQRQFFKVNGTWHQPPYQTSRNYNRAGNVISQIYPSGHTVTYTYDSAGRIDSFSGNLGDNNNRTYSTAVIYSPFGGMTKEQLGTTTPIFNKRFYNSRGQLAEIRAATTYSGPTDTSWNRGAIINHFSDQCWGMCGGTNSSSQMTDNNGNLRKQDVYIPNDDQISGYTMRYQQYDYDSLNRLNSVREIKDGADQWKQQFSYDRWGNRTIHAATWGTGINNKSFEKEDATNRLYSPGDLALADNSRRIRYDAAGNQIKDTYTGYGTANYDAENRITSIHNSSAGWSNYTYDALGNRTRRKTNNQETWQVYGFNEELLAEYQANGDATNPQKEYGYRNGQLLITAEPAAAGATNVALASSGATVTVSSTLNNPPWSYHPSSVINGDHKGLNIGNNGNWAGSSTTLPQWVEVAFNGSKSINQIDVFSLQDNYQNPVEPTESTTFSLYGLTAFEVQYWNNGAWTTVPGGSVSGNNKVWKKITFAPLTTTKIRVHITATSDNWSRMVEVEAWTPGAPPPNVALASNGATVTASSTWSNPPFSYLPSSINNGDHRGLNPGNNSNWASNGTSLPQWVEVAFNGSKTINQIDVFSLQDNYQSPIEPTESTTFSLYGLTAFEVQYWNNGAWVTVPGGSVSGNNKVWKKFTFAPITTTKIRVYITGTSDNWSRIVEVEAWATSPGANIKWLVSDHLGTPRMIIDQTGSLANVKRHDYLPFGEELFGGTTANPGPGGRTATQGYACDPSDPNCVPDLVRQQFTAQERDVETGLDYFSSRYHSAVQGRFTSPDSFGGIKVNPQTLNLYAYVMNNPLKFVDPSGHIAQDPSRPNPNKQCSETDPCDPDENDTIKTTTETPYYIPNDKQMYTDWWDVLMGRMSYAAYFRNSDRRFVQQVRQGFARGQAISKEIDKGLQDPGVQVLLMQSGILGALQVERVLEAGSIKLINLGFPYLKGTTQNCINCAVAFDATLAGRNASALPAAEALPISVVEAEFGTTFSAPTTIAKIEAQILGAGNGARGIVFGEPVGGGTGHVVNVVNQGGVVRFLDAQRGAVANFEGFTNFRLLRTN